MNTLLINLKIQEVNVVKPIKRKSMMMRYSGRSSDYLSPSFGQGCLLDCSYCYCKRHKPIGLDYATNIEQILTEINSHVTMVAPFDQNLRPRPDQVDPKYIVYDISCNEDFALHHKYYPWQKIFAFFRDHQKAKATLATKVIAEDLLTFDPKKKVRIRFSLMPQKLSSIYEPNTPKIIDRINAVNSFITAGYEVHLNFSPVIIYSGWQQDYIELFELVNATVLDKFKLDVLSEVIFLTHNIHKHQANVENNKPGEQMLWDPVLQEPKESIYGGHNVRYRINLKERAVEEFKMLHDRIIPWNTIRYIF